jgi:dimethylargininase
MLSNEGERLKQVVVCTPRKEYARASNLEKHNIGELGDPKLAIQQHDTLKSKLRDFGAEVIDIPELAEHPNSVFTRDTALCTPQGYVKLRPGLETRQGEEGWMAEALEAIEEPCVGGIEAPGTVEGGDIVLAGKVAFIGRSIRTNKYGIRQLSTLLEMIGYEVRLIELPDTILHIDKALMALGPEQVLYCREIVPKEKIKGFEGIGISCSGDTTANIICLGNKELIVNSSNSIVIARLESERYIVHSLDLSEFAKGMGGPNCLIMPVERGS